MFVCKILDHSQKNAKWEESITLSKQDKLYKDAMITAAASNSSEVAEELLSYFVDIGNKECFGAMLFICFDLLPSDTVMELSWQHGLNDFYMPYAIQSQRLLVEKVCNHIEAPMSALVLIPNKVSALEKEVKERSKKDTQKEQLEADAPIINPGSRLLLTNGYEPNNLLLSSSSHWRRRFPGQAPPNYPNGNGLVPVSPSAPYPSTSHRRDQNMTGFPTF